MPIRKAEPRDARGIAEVTVAAWRVAYRGLLPDSLLDNLSVEDRENRWRLRISEYIWQTLVLEQRGCVIGFVAFGASHGEGTNQGRGGEIFAIYLSPEEWGRGHGSALMDAALRSLREGGYTEVTLWVLDGNERGKGFYEAMGFEADGGTKVEVRKDGTEMREARYRRVILEANHDGTDHAEDSR